MNDFAKMRQCCCVCHENFAYDEPGDKFAQNITIVWVLGVAICS